VHEFAPFLAQHRHVTRRYFLRLAAAGTAVAGCGTRAGRAAAPAPPLAEALARLESYFTRPEDFRDVSRGDPIPHTLPDDRKAEVGLTRDTWQLEIVTDPEHPADIGRPLSQAAGTALSFAGLMRLAKEHAVRVPKVMTCLNIGCPLGTGIWEGVPLRELFWLTQPRKDIRRVYYYGYHNDDPGQVFRSSLPLWRVLDDPGDLPPVIVCYKLNGQWLTAERGGPVRIVVPEAYGFKSVKWLQRIVVTNLYHANDTYASGNNDIDSPLKTWAATLSIPRVVQAGAPIPVTGYAQVGITGLRKVQVWVHSDEEPLPAGAAAPYFGAAPWKDAEVLPPPSTWGGGLPGDQVPAGTLGFRQGQPVDWPLRLAKVHWATLLPGLPAGQYTFRCRTIDQNGAAQPMPRPFRKSGHAAIEAVDFTVDS
jgi:DMSO/TMAO reductase YedYZ molybdopterin-dependent catalytic subunit